MTDLISREKTLYRLATSAVYYFDLEEDQAAHNWAMHIVSGMPDEEPERKKGKWTSENACEFCGFQPWYERDIHTLSYCPNCGADMREREGEW